MISLRPYLQLVRLPNVFTALADILMGAIAAGAHGWQWLNVAFLLGSSACLYCAGMVWNDFFDWQEDRKERPARPIPSGRIARRTAGQLGTVLLAAGWLLAAATAGPAEGFASANWLWKSPALAGFLVTAILLYNAWLKRTVAGPLAMGTCRFLNVLLGISVVGAIHTLWQVHLAAVIGLYIMGVTWLARTEATSSSPSALLGSAVTMLASLFLGLALPASLAPGSPSPLFVYLLVIVGFIVGLPICRALADPRPAPVQQAVGRCLLGLVFLDAVMTTAFGRMAGLFILGLLVPILLLRRLRWLYVT
jgi:4-hydroxybenzoate polyprenyltransferase